MSIMDITQQFQNRYAIVPSRKIYLAQNRGTGAPSWTQAWVEWSLPHSWDLVGFSPKGWYGAIANVSPPLTRLDVRIGCIAGWATHEGGGYKNWNLKSNYLIKVPNESL